MKIALNCGFILLRLLFFSYTFCVRFFWSIFIIYKIILCFNLWGQVCVLSIGSIMLFFFYQKNIYKKCAGRVNCDSSSGSSCSWSLRSSLFTYFVVFVSPSCITVMNQNAGYFWDPVAMMHKFDPCWYADLQVK